MTHEAYKGYIGQYFGDIVPLIITDDVKVSWMPWTDDLAECFKKEKGYDILDFLPSLFQGVEKHDMQVRIDYYDWWTKRFAEAYFGQIQDWCRKNGLASCGHLGGEEDILRARVHGHGHALRNFRRFDIPGVDCVWRQIFPVEENVEIEAGMPLNEASVSLPVRLKTDGKTCRKNGVFDFSGLTDQMALKNNHFPKYASTVAHQEGKQHSFIELFGVYGSGLTVGQMKWITDFSYVRGINLASACEAYISTKDYYMAAMRPMLSPSNPLWKYFEYYHSYTARLSYLLSLGKPVVDTAVYYPIKDIWAGDMDMIRAVDKSFETLSTILFRNRCDFDFLDDDTLEKESTEVINGKIRVGEMEYSTVYISKCGWMSVKSKEKLRRFASHGGRVVWADNEAEVSDPEKAYILISGD